MSNRAIKTRTENQRMCSRGNGWRMGRISGLVLTEDEKTQEKWKINECRE